MIHRIDSENKQPSLSQYCVFVRERKTVCVSVYVTNVNTI